MDDVCIGLSGVRGSLAPLDFLFSVAVFVSYIKANTDQVKSFCLATRALVLAIKRILFPTYWTATSDV